MHLAEITIVENSNGSDLGETTMRQETYHKRRGGYKMDTIAYFDKKRGFKQNAQILNG